MGLLGNVVTGVLGGVAAHVNRGGHRRSIVGSGNRRRFSGRRPGSCCVLDYLSAHRRIALIKAKHIQHSVFTGLLCLAP